MTDIVTAIRNINPNAQVTCNDEDYNQIEWLNNTPVIPNEDIQAKINELKIAKANEEQTIANAKVSGNQKLLDLGLSQTEVTALTGYTPPSEE